MWERKEREKRESSRERKSYMFRCIYTHWSVGLSDTGFVAFPEAQSKVLE
jgi:hypothetical protein